MSDDGKRILTFNFGEHGKDVLLRLFSITTGHGNNLQCEYDSEEELARNCGRPKDDLLRGLGELTSSGAVSINKPNSTP